MVAALSDALGGVDILVNAAAMPGGVVAPPKLADVTTDALWAEINTKVMGYLRCAREVAPLMAAQRLGPHHQRERAGRAAVADRCSDRSATCRSRR